MWQKYEICNNNNNHKKKDSTEKHQQYNLMMAIWYRERGLLFRTVSVLGTDCCTVGVLEKFCSFVITFLGKPEIESILDGLTKLQTNKIFQGFRNTSILEDDDAENLLGWNET